jgi:ABC-type transporter Mla subunit MlaD
LPKKKSRLRRRHREALLYVTLAITLAVVVVGGFAVLYMNREPNLYDTPPTG